ncbi:HNH endonuclease signature motif containing protein [Streptomyces huasconensis]|uniref:HNH endonuclease signature motif containing protein n=1 Tax=Streptomyces huasconensis TaxID=1854574 RepID=A0ABV3M8D1_9ACTN
MPRAASICLVGGCPQRTVRAGRCSDHAPAERPWLRASARNRVRDAARRLWDRQVRPRALVRDGFACVRCHDREGLEVDHVLPIAQGGTWTLENAQTLCRRCHAEKTATERRKK